MLFPKILFLDNDALDNKLDERQLLIRGNIFRHMFICMAVMLFADSILSSAGVVWAEGNWPRALILAVPCGAGMFEMILRDVMLITKFRTRLYVQIMTAVPITLIFGVISGLRRGGGLVGPEGLTTVGIWIIIAVCFVPVPIIAIIKERMIKKGEKNASAG